jgi:putative nucleotidyltransferase with HDIG domain
MKNVPNFEDLVSAFYPELVGRVKRVIEESERQYARKKGQAIEGGESFLWEHTREVAAVAMRLAVAEGVDPLLPVTAALFHDIGKFSGGRYHADDIPEEEEAAGVARQMLEAAGMPEDHMLEVVGGLQALYHENVESNHIADVVHDADFLCKFGLLGTAHFFQKAALRGRPLQRAMLRDLSKELTYAACLPLNMRCAAAVKMAEKKRKDSLLFFKGLLRELRDAGIGDYRVEVIEWQPGQEPKTGLEVRLVIPSACESCGSSLKVVLSTQGGIKCRKLTADVRCRGCGHSYDISFCLPEVKSKR